MAAQATDFGRRETMTERPIIFSGPMVRAILEGRKTQTRRVAKRNDAGRVQLAGRQWHIADPDAIKACPLGQPGDTLWVRETFYIDQMPWDVMRLPKQRPADLDGRDIYYRADGECCQQIPECSCGEVGKPRWRPSIHMPRWAARLFLRVTAVRVERLRHISLGDCVAEGMAPTMRNDSEDARDRFRALWDSLNAKRGYGWEANPWVWVIGFERLTSEGGTQ